MILTFFVGLLVGRYTIFLIQKSLSIFISAVDKTLNKYFFFFLLAICVFILFSLIFTGSLMLLHILMGGITSWVSLYIIWGGQLEQVYGASSLKVILNEN